MNCSNCGKMLINQNAKFCPFCGTPVIAESNQYTNTRKVVYDGIIHKCPNCGETINADSLVCPTCRFQFDRQDSYSDFSSFFSQLMDFENQRKGYDTIIFDPFEYIDIKPSSISQKEAMFIRNYPISNNLDDIYEFMLIAISNIKPMAYSQFHWYPTYSTLKQQSSDRLISDAWNDKYQELFVKLQFGGVDKSKIAFLQKKHDEKMNEIETMKVKDKNYQIKGITICLCIFVAMFILIGWLAKTSD